MILMIRTTIQKVMTSKKLMLYLVLKIFKAYFVKTSIRLDLI